MRIAPVVALLALALAGCGGTGDAERTGAPPTQAVPPVAPADTTPGEVGAPERVQVTLAEQGGSGVSGRAELTPEDGATFIVIELDGSDADAIPYLQEGECAAPRAEAAEVLPLFVDGRSETTVDVELTNLLNGRFVIALHPPDAAELQQPLACGEIRPEGS